MRGISAAILEGLTARSIPAQCEILGKDEIRTLDTIEGTWRFVRAMARDDAGNQRPPPYEGQGMGRIVIGSSRMAVMMIDWRHDVPADQKREYSGYTGSYTYDGKQLVTTVDAAPDPGRIGTKQARGVRFENGLMILIPPPRVVNGVTEHREIAWEKVSDV
jgi:hypothetical protein